MDLCRKTWKNFTLSIYVSDREKCAKNVKIKWVVVDFFDFAGAHTLGSIEEKKNFKVHAYDFYYIVINNLLNPCVKIPLGNQKSLSKLYQQA